MVRESTQYATPQTSPLESAPGRCRHTEVVTVQARERLQTPLQVDGLGHTIVTGDRPVASRVQSTWRGRRCAGLSDATQHDSAVKSTSQISVAQQRPWLIPFIVVMGAGLGARLLVVLVTSPVWWSDSTGYMQLARLIGRGNLAAGQGLRTPGYSVFILLNGFNLSAIRVTQMIMGLAVTAGVFWIIWTLNHKPWLASLGALLYGLAIAQVRLESSIVAETLATALLLGAVVTLVSLRTGQRRDWWKLLAMGVFAGLLPLVRPPVRLCAFDIRHTRGFSGATAFATLLALFLAGHPACGCLGRLSRSDIRLRRPANDFRLRLDQSRGSLHEGCA